jgi:hypothetical protein
MTPTTTIAGHYRVPTPTTVAVTTVPVGQQWTPNPLTTSTGNTTAGTVTPGWAEIPAPSPNLQGTTHVVNTPTNIPVATTVTTGVPLAVTAANAFPNVYTEPYTRVNDRRELGPTQATPINNPPLEPAPTRVDTRLISPRQAEFARRHAATSRGNVQPIINDTIEVEVGTPLDARGGDMQWITVPMKEFYQTRTESFPTDAVICIQHDDVIIQRLPTTGVQGNLPEAIIPPSLLQPRTAFPCLKSYAEKIYDRRASNIVIATAVGKNHVETFRQWDDQLKGSAPPLVRTLASPPSNSELLAIQQHRLSELSVSLGACVTDAVQGCIGFQLIINTSEGQQMYRPSLCL